jgi:2-isopropylmalate synthase
MAQRVRADRLPYRTGVNAAQIFASSELLSRVTGQYVQPNKAVVGRNAFAHEAGIHQDGMLKDRRTYEIMRPEDVGAPSHSLVLGKHSGRRAVQPRCAELGVPVNDAQLEKVYEALMTLGRSS